MDVLAVTGEFWKINGFEMKLCVWGGEEETASQQFINSEQKKKDKEEKKIAAVSRKNKPCLIHGHMANRNIPGEGLTG